VLCCDCLCLQVEISKSYSHADWREDLKRLLRRAGCDSKRIMFLFTDSQIKDEAFVEDINNMLNAGEVPNMFPSDEKMQVRAAAVQACNPAHATSVAYCNCRTVLPSPLCSSALCGCWQHQPFQPVWSLSLNIRLLGLSCVQILEAVRPEAAKLGLESPLQLWGYFVSACKRNLHIVLCMSPIGDACR
jgi:hypothetical protein